MAADALPATPFLALDLPAFERNMASMARTIVTQGGKRWRPHTKAIRSPALMQRLIDAGASGVTCATAGEARAMVEFGIHDVLVASPVAAPGALAELARLNRGARVIATIDALEHVALLSAAAREAGVVVPVVIEVDIGLGRAGVPPGEAALALAQTVGSHDALRFCGLMAWEGQTTRIADAQAKQAAVAASVGRLLQSAQCCRDADVTVEIVSCSGTGTYLHASSIDGVTELQAGGGVFGDLRYREEFHVPLAPALTLHSTVLSRPTARRIVCDAGWKYHSLHPTPAQPLGLSGQLHLAWSAEHLTVECPHDTDWPRIGERIELAIGYADATVFMHRELFAMRHGAIEDVLPLPARH